MNKTKFAIGCLVQWYEADIVGEYFKTLRDAIDYYGEDVHVDICISCNTDLEKPESDDTIYNCWKSIVHEASINKFEPSLTSELVTIADYRRKFNDDHCETANVLIWGETDMLVPKQMFSVLDMLHQNVQTSKYVATFGICKMWDESWKQLEHPEFTDMPFEDIPGSEKNWWMANYLMNVDEMNAFNDKVDELEVTQIQPHKFNGCGLVISSEVIKSGVNIPKSVFFVHEDTAFMMMIRKVLGDIPQYHIRNVLLVHNRKHPNKRRYIANETGDTIGQKRKSNKWYEIANKMSEQNCYNNFNAQYKPFTWDDVWNNIK
jgi:hypothetical protein